MKNVKTAKFKTGTYKIDLLDGPVFGFCEDPQQTATLHMAIPNGGTKRDLATCVHEMMHAEGIPDRYLDEERDAAIYIARLLWRMGWRKTAR